MAELLNLTENVDRVKQAATFWKQKGVLEEHKSPSLEFSQDISFGSQADNTEIFYLAVRKLDLRNTRDPTIEENSPMEIRGRQEEIKNEEPNQE